MVERVEPLLCPVDQSVMVISARQGIEIDYCPTCRGVWLDRGELEKMMEAAQYSRPIDPPAPSQPGPRYEPAPDPRSETRDRYDRGRHWDDDDHRKKKRRGLDIFDIFD